MLTECDRFGTQCYDRKDAIIANWDNEGQILHISANALPILDRIVVTCMLNLWMRNRNEW